MQPTQVHLIFSQDGWSSCSFITVASHFGNGEYIPRNFLNLDLIELGILTIEKDNDKTFIDVDSIVAIKTSKRSAQENNEYNPFARGLK